MAEKVESQQLNDSELEELERLAYTKKRYLSPKEIAAFVLVNFGKKNLDQFTSAFKEFFMIQFLKLNTTAYANINLFASIYDAADDTISGLIIYRTRTRWGRIRPFLILSLPMWLIGGYMMFTAPDLNSTQKIVWSAIGILLYGLGQNEKANKIIDELANKSLEYMIWYLSLTDYQLSIASENFMARGFESL